MASVVKFFLWTYLITWSFWIAAIVTYRPVQPNAAAFREVLLLMGTVAPAIVGLTLSAREGGGSINSVLFHLFKANVGRRWYLLAIFYMPVVKGLVAVSYLAVVGRWPEFGHEGPLLIAGAILISTPMQAGEEIGWRGYALPRMAARFGLGPASLLLGLVWSMWHLPTFFLPGTDKYGQSFPVYAAGVVAFSVVLAWLYGHTGGSVLLTMLMHSAIDQTIGIVPDGFQPGEKPFALGASLPFLLTVVWMWIGALYFLARMPAVPSPGAQRPTNSYAE